MFICFFFQAEDGIRDKLVTGVQTCALPIFALDRPLFAGHSHATAVRTASYLGSLAIERLELRPAETVHELSVKLPGLPRVVHDGQGDVMVGGIVLQFLSGLEPVLNQLTGPRIIQRVLLHCYFGRPKLHGVPPYMLSFFGM